MKTQSPTELLEQEQTEVLQEIHEAESRPNKAESPQKPVPREEEAAG